ncbi:MAG: bifunctional diaminohydroxyphosphoribosylaminopyrimidine deaminase/5-amino-6-(5-phosphoribosylamino)uracil reductase RibD [Gammaproteobacteria bacterium]|nr:bifunctional diaminohydroxyphosphoribosylaminopyrimidine deaminase/5-amino-6-(5-phosphoribosylamino)uracil reductase RibD [Gammaproteobacteria bacterium]
MFSADDYKYMARAIQLAKKPFQAPHPNPRVGCVIVKNGQIIGEGFHAKAGEPHAEVHALQQAGAAAENATVYVTLEPCAHMGRTPPCANALVNAKVAKVIAAMTDPNPKVSGKGLAILHEAGIEAEHGLLEPQAEALNRGFIKRMKTGRPWVRTKLAMSVDGRTAMADGESQWITGAEARKDVQHWRANADAILTGSGTVVYDDPQLNVRDIPVDDIRQPLRVVIDSRQQVSKQARVIDQPGKVWLAGPEKGDYPDNVELHVAARKNDNIDLDLLLERLGEHDINEVHVEAGATLNGVLLEQGLVDEIIIYMAPIILGNKARGLFNLQNIHSMQDKLLLECTDVRQVGGDTRFVFRRLSPKVL